VRAKKWRVGGFHSIYKYHDTVRAELTVNGLISGFEPDNDQGLHAPKVKKKMMVKKKIGVGQVSGGGHR